MHVENQYRQKHKRQIKNDYTPNCQRKFKEEKDKLKNKKHTYKTLQNPQFNNVLMRITTHNINYRFNNYVFINF